tara:strand:- start:1087 stop:1392 length:306 start_codon:yes stop_codon:yes gene_type:complete
MITTLVIVALLLLTGVSIYYFEFYKKGKINDRDGDYIPDEVEDAVEDVKKGVKEVKRRAKRVKEELKDVAVAAKEVVNQSKDVVAAAKGKRRKGRKPKNSK